MPSQTTKGLPYPLGSDILKNGAVDIQALAQALDFTKVTLLSPSAVVAADFMESYALGISVQPLAASAAVSGGWPGGVACHVFTIKSAANRAAQFVYTWGTTGTRAWYRSLGNNPGPNSPWAGGAAPYAELAGPVTLNAATNPTASVQVNFPAGRFTQAPRVVVSPQTPSMSVGVQTITSAAVVFIGRNIATYTATFVSHWIAVQGLSTDSDG